MKFPVPLWMLCLGLPLSAAHAESFSVSNGNDSGPGSLREAIIGANAVTAPDQQYIDFASGVDEVVLTTPLPQLKKHLFFNFGHFIGENPPAVAVRRAASAPVFNIFDVGANASIIMRALKLSGGSTPGNGGLIRNAGELSLRECTLSGGSAELGGAISNEAGGRLNIQGSTLKANVAQDGGAIFNNGELYMSGSTLNGNRAKRGAALSFGDAKKIRASGWIYNTTVTGNSATAGGGGIYVQPAFVTLDSCTVVRNSSPEGTGSGLAVVGTMPGSNNCYVQVGNTILAGNSPTGGQSPGGSDVSFASQDGTYIISKGHNLVGSSQGPSMPFQAAGDRLGYDSNTILLESLGDYGGPTQTMPLLSGSPALDTGSTDLTTDQRGAGRGTGAADDIGAFEGLADGNHAPVATPFAFGGRVGFDLSLQLMASDIDGDALTYKIVSGHLPAGVTLNPSTGVISGLQTKVVRNGYFSFQVSDGKTLSNVAQCSYGTEEARSSVVNTSAEPDYYDSKTSLSEAIDAAVELRNNPTITFDLAPGDRVITLSQPLGLLFENLSIVGPTTGGGVRIQRSSAPGVLAFRIFSVTNATVNLKNLTLSGGLSAESGGAISNVGGQLTVENCTLTGNQARYGGAVYTDNENGGYTGLYNCTLSGNSALGLDSTPIGGGAIYNKGYLNLQACTIAGNSAPLNKGGAIYSSLGGTSKVRLGNCILVGSLTNGVSPQFNPDFPVDPNHTTTDITATYVSSGHNAIGFGEAVQAVKQSGDSRGETLSSVALLPLADNGGPTPTMAILDTSVALDRGDTFLDTDQRGLARPFGTNSDIGAFEARADAAPVFESVTLTPAAPLNGDTLTANVVVTDPDGTTPILTYRWTRTRGEGTTSLPVTGPTLELSAPTFQPGDIVQVEVTARDNFNQRHQTAQVIIGNGAISITSIKLQPSSPYTFDQMFVTVQTADPDKTRPLFSYVWTKNGVVVKTDTNSRSNQNFYDLKAPGHGDKGDVIEMTVVASDGSTSATSKASATIRNSVPVLSLLTLTPEAPTPQNVVTSNFGGRDADGDDLTRIYKWKIGKKVLTDEKGARLNLSKYPFVKAGDVVSLELRLTDGEALSKTRTAQVTVVAPTPPASVNAPLTSGETSGNAS